jgi:hypothetical protein
VSVRPNKFKTQGAPDYVAFLCDTLVEHGRRPTKILQRAGLDFEAWEHPDVAKALFTAAQPFLQPSATAASGYADFSDDPSDSDSHSDA